MNNMNSYFSIITLGCGVYCLYVWFQVHRGAALSQNNLILPRDKTLDDCLDKAEFLHYVKPRLLVFSILIMLSGAFGMVNDQLGLIDQWTAGMSDGMHLLVLELLTCFLPLAIVIWFAVSLRRIHKALW